MFWCHLCPQDYVGISAIADDTTRLSSPGANASTTVFTDHHRRACLRRDAAVPAERAARDSRHGPRSDGLTMSEVIEQPAPDGKYMIDSYGDWAAGEGVPIVTAEAVDLLNAETKPWTRFATNGA